MKTLNNLTTTLLVYLVAQLLNGVLCQYHQQTSINIEMDKAGMHRKLRYTVQFDKTILGLNCEYIIAQNLPAAVYISTDELDDLKRLKMLSAVYPEFVDVEAITEKAQPFSVLLRGSTKKTETITLPIHFRYHAASRKRGTGKVTLKAPRLYLSCPMSDKESIDMGLLDDDKVYCLDEGGTDFKEQINPVQCNWRRLALNLNAGQTLFTEIPVGDANRYAPVLYATIILSWVAAFWIVIRTWPVARRINDELSEAHFDLQDSKVK